MTATKFALVYSESTEIIRRVIVPDRDEDLGNVHVAGDGEVMVVGDLATYVDYDSAHSVFTALMGREPGHGRCAVIDDHGNVVNLQMACPDLDSIPGHLLVQSKDAQVGWTWTQAEGFKAPPEPPAEAPLEINIPDGHVPMRIISLD